MAKKNSKGLYEGVVYRRVLLTECDEKGFSYIGETYDESGRISNWNKPKNKSYGGKKITEAREKYGVKDWDYIVLEIVEAPTIDELKKKLEEKEAHWISYYDSVNRGFNTADEGTGNHGVNFSKEHRQKIGAASLGRHHTDETKAKLSQSLTGRTQTQETKEKISAGLKGKKRSPEQIKAQSDRMKLKGEPKAASAGAAKWRANNPGGWWKTHSISPESIEKGRETRKKNLPKIKAINATTGEEEVFDFMNDAAKRFKIGVGSVYHYLKKSPGMVQKKSGCRFEYVA